MLCDERYILKKVEGIISDNDFSIDDLGNFYFSDEEYFYLNSDIKEEVLESEEEVFENENSSYDFVEELRNIAGEIKEVGWDTWLNENFENSETEHTLSV